MRLELEVIPEFVINFMYILHINVFYHSSSKNTGLKYIRKVSGDKVAACQHFETNRSKFMSTVEYAEYLLHFWFTCTHFRINTLV